MDVEIKRFAKMNIATRREPIEKTNLIFWLKNLNNRLLNVNVTMIPIQAANQTPRVKLRNTLKQDVSNKKNIKLSYFRLLLGSDTMITELKIKYKRLKLPKTLGSLIVAKTP